MLKIVIHFNGIFKFFFFLFLLIFVTFRIVVEMLIGGCLLLTNRELSYYSVMKDLDYNFMRCSFTSFFK